ncbi:YbaK/EbsC family protein [Pseudoroseicyclus tamaricis]|uniref:YbaK/EbsC family protein n=1 Tax=Pseudoroseicyclus tamaricis TaxID=2705421 RepID=A0A6B2JW45_9RHOB|nr:YbaK/EbsC family protein [Pseudoroseicyclus tamaricis]NDV00869.1 YbaK/EbsC family protein [Pseudoroseicyclus tamaricis]
MSKSLKRVTAILEEAGLPGRPVEVGEARTAEQAAEAAGCHLDQIAKSIIFAGEESGAVYLFLTAGGNRVSAEKAAGLAGEPLRRASGEEVRAQTGFAIGGVSPVGHLSAVNAFFDPRLAEFEEVWAAAGTPRHIFPIAPDDLLRLSGAVPGDFT